MKNVWAKYKWILLLLINALPFGLHVLFYPIGLVFDLALFLPILFCLTFLNYMNCGKVYQYILLQLFFFICMICSLYASLYLHHHNIASDSMSLVVGKLFLIFECAAYIVATAATTVVKAVKNRRRVSGEE